MIIKITVSQQQCSDDVISVEHRLKETMKVMMKWVGTDVDVMTSVFMEK